MKTMQPNRSRSSAPTILLSIALAAAIAMLAGCERAKQAADSTQTPSRVAQPVVDERPLGQVTEFDGFTLRANVSPTESLPDAMARQYGIEAGPDRALLNLVVSEKRPDGRTVSVSAEVSAQYESLIGHAAVIDMRAVEADGHVSYIGILDTGGQRIFRFAIEARPAGTDQPLQMNFEVQLPKVDTE